MEQVGDITVPRWIAHKGDGKKRLDVENMLSFLDKAKISLPRCVAEYPERIPKFKADEVDIVVFIRQRSTI